MNHPSLSSVKHEVTYRFIGGAPENGILSCGFMRKKSAQKSQIDFVIPYYSCFLLLQGSGEYWDETGARQLPIDLLIRLAQYYGVSTDYILELTDNPAPYPPKSKKK